MKIKNLIFIILAGLFAALTAIGAFIKIPLPYLPLTLQVFFCLLAGILLGPKWGAASQLVYIAIGLTGIPVFTNGGGPGYIFQPSFGYLLGLIACASVIGLITQRLKKITVTRLFLINLLGVLVIYAIGLPYLYIIFNAYMGKPTTLAKVLSIGFITTVPGDILKSYLAALIGAKLLPAVKKLIHL